MPDFFDSLLQKDLGFLRIIAELWGLELDSKNADAAREKLTIALLDPNLFAELIDSLSPEAEAAIDALVNAGGRIPWPTFTRRFGEIREAGAGKRDRTKPHLNPTSAAEVLYYRGLLGRSFFDTEKGPQEFAYLPDDLLSLLSREEREEKKEKLGSDPAPLGRPASPGEKGQEIPATDSILDDATTLLAALRTGKSDGSSDRRLYELLKSAKLIENHVLHPEAVKSFLEASREESLKMLQDAWVESIQFNELRLMPGIICEGEWRNQPQETREFLLNLLDAIPEGKWWSLNAFVRDVKQKYADFQRPAGDYDSWFIKRVSDEQYLRGFESWDEVDGALVRFFITGILHWLGQVDVAIADGAKAPTSFRITSIVHQKEERGKITVASSGKITIPRDAPRVVRYQISRFCEWEEPKSDVYRYHLTTNSLNKAKEQGLKVEHLLALLARHSDAGVPPVIVKALKRWEANGTEARVQTQVILKVSRPEILEEMRKSKAAKYLGEVLSPTAVIVKSGAIQKVIDALTELGLLSEVITD
ncbi:MAG TPA: helicase-associated domain-containing protein [Anaerolineales bacterium]|nr:helicase-associated domain-containing protein [Anaerolineales bacterium]